MKARLVKGWRTASIERCLDFCAAVDGYVYIEWADEGQRHTWSSAQEQKRMWARTHRAVANANSKLQWQKQDARIKADYSRYVDLYRARFPWSTPIGRDRWRRYHWKAFLADPHGSLIENSACKIP